MYDKTVGLSISQWFHCPLARNLLFGMAILLNLVKYIKTTIMFIVDMFTHTVSSKVGDLTNITILHLPQCLVNLVCLYFLYTSQLRLSVKNSNILVLLIPYFIFTLISK